MCFVNFVWAKKKVEPAGRAFHAVHEKPLIDAKRRGKGPVKEADAKEASDDDQDAGSWKKKRKEGGAKKGALKLSAHLEGEDLYTLLGVSEGASVDQIKKQYRKLALQHHPDKQADDKGDDVAANGLTNKDMLFVKLQEAYEVLSDQTRRRQYDSTLDFDEDIPDEVEKGSTFYKTFAPVFARNSRFSTRPAPELGDEKTDINKVHKFYDFWANFDSWRDFSMHDEYNLDEAEFREERRWMERQNQRGRKKYVDAERKRILRLAETAERLDPRIRAEREEKEAKKREERERKARLKQDEEDAKKREEEDRQRQEAQEKAEREEKERAEKEQRQQNKELSKKLRQRLKKRVQSACKLDALAAEDLQTMCLELTSEQLESLCVKLEATTKVEATTHAEIAEWKRRQTEEAEEQAKKREARREQKKETKEIAGSPWVAEELGLLAKGLQKIPGGMANRWTLINQILRAGGYSRTDKEVIEKVKELSDGKSLRSVGAVVSSTEGMSTLQNAQTKALAKPNIEGKPDTKADEAKAADEAEWSGEQQRALEQALQKYPSSLDKNERWRLIADDVPGKSKAQCVDRFKFLRQQLSKDKK